MTTDDKKRLLWLVLLALAVVAGLVGGIVTGSWQEARAYNRLTGGEATTWDAIWVQLRVTGEVRDD